MKNEHDATFIDAVRENQNRLAKIWSEVYDADWAYDELVDTTTKLLSILCNAPVSNITVHSPKDEDGKTPEHHGVYVVYETIDEPPYFQWVYIGQSRNIRQRVKNGGHPAGKHPYFAITRVDPSVMEKRLIKSLRPVLNVMHNGGTL